MKTAKRTAFAFVLLMGLVSLFSDMTHEGAASIMGRFLNLAGASVAAIAFISGLGEFIGYSLRVVSGFFTDRTKRYWPMVIAGYVIDCLAIPALALVPPGGWKWAFLLIAAHRFGKAVKKPAKDTLLSFAGSQGGLGKSFAIQEFLDQIGAFLGPLLLFAVVLLKKGGEAYEGYRTAFAVLGIPAVLTVALLLFARKKYPHPETFEPPAKGEVSAKLFSRPFLLCLIGACLFAAGYIDFSVITAHAAGTGLLSDDALPLLYAGAMAADAFSALFFGWLFDRRGVRTLSLSTLLASPFALLIFVFASRWSLFLGVALWGVGMGAQESVLKAAVSKTVPRGRRSSGFGVFHAAFGFCWFLGSWLTGVLYENAPLWMAVFSAGAQLAAIPFFLRSGRNVSGAAL